MDGKWKLQEQNAKLRLENLKGTERLGGLGVLQPTEKITYFNGSERSREQRVDSIKLAQNGFYNELLWTCYLAFSRRTLFRVTHNYLYINIQSVSQTQILILKKQLSLQVISTFVLMHDFKFGYDTSYLGQNVRGFIQSLQENAGMLQRLSNNRFLPSPSQFIIHLSSYHPTLYSSTLKASLKNPRKKYLEKEFVFKYT